MSSRGTRLKIAEVRDKIEEMRQHALNDLDVNLAEEVVGPLLSWIDTLCICLNDMNARIVQLEERPSTKP